MLQTCFHRGWPYYEYHSFRKELAEHTNNWCADLDTLRRMAKEEWTQQLQNNEPRATILARIPADTALEWGFPRHVPLVDVCVCGHMVVCLENGWRTYIPSPAEKLALDRTNGA